MRNGNEEPPDPQRVPTVGRWTILLPRGFQVVNNGDTLQAYSGARVIFVSAMSIADPAGRPMAAMALRGAAAEALTTMTGEAYSQEGEEVCGDAKIFPDGTAWRLQGYKCATGSLATCVIDYVDERDRAWAEASWQSLEQA